MPNCHWASCNKTAKYTVSGHIGPGGTKTRVAFCSPEHLAAWAIKQSCPQGGQWNTVHVEEAIEQHVTDIRDVVFSKEPV